MQLSLFGTQLTAHSGILQLMDDLGRALAEGGDICMLGGGNPSHIPAVEKLFRERMEQILAIPGEFERLLGDYDPPQGKLSFIKYLAELLQRELGWPVGPENIALTPGSQASFFMLFNMFGGMGENGIQRKILLPMSPEYIGYANAGISPDFFVSAKPRMVMTSPHRFKYYVDFDALPLAEPLGAICVSRPTNPTGNVLTDAEVRQLLGLAKSSDIPLILDNAYGAPFPNILFTPVQPLWDDALIHCLSLSKLGLPGTRTGIIVASAEIIHHITSINAIMHLAPSGIGPALVLELVKSGEILRLSRTVIEPYYRARMQAATALLDELLQGCDYYIHEPEGAMFLWLWFKDLPVSNEHLYQRLKERGVLVVSGHYFFPGLIDTAWQHPYECLRLTYSQDPEMVRQGLKILAEEVKRGYSEGGIR